MIDLNRLRETTEQTKKLILLKEPSFPVDRLVSLDEQVRSIKTEVELLRKEKNSLASMGAKGASPEIREKSIVLGTMLKEKEAHLEVIEAEFTQLWLSCPNIPQEDLPVGGKEANKSVSVIGEKPSFAFPFKNHVELNEKLGWFDLTTTSTMVGSQFVMYRGMGAKIIYALTRLMLQNNTKYGFEVVLPPYMIAERGLYNAGELPKFKGAYYKIEQEDLCLIPTAEVSLTNIHANQILSQDQLPLRYTSWTSCFRREAGGYGATERGLIRIHQFEKVEIYSISTPEDSDKEQQRMLECAQGLLKQLGLHYRVTLLAAQDCSFQSTKTFDIEVWLPGQDRYYEVSSCSNCGDFQARRAGIRYRIAHDAKPKLVHTLNASALALPRLMVALMENFQQADGSIALPPVLQKAIEEAW